MTIEQSIRALWSSYQPLCEMAPSERVVTGAARGALPYPYVTLERQAAGPNTRTSSGTLLDRPVVRLSVWDESLDRAQAIAALAQRRLDGAQLETTREALLDLRASGSFQTEQEDGAWRVGCDYHALVRSTAVAPTNP